MEEKRLDPLRDHHDETVENATEGERGTVGRGGMGTVGSRDD